MSRRIRVHRRWAGLPLGAALLALAPAAAAQSTLGFGFVDITAGATGPLGVEGSVGTCVFVETFGVPITGGLHEDVFGPVDPAPCSLPLSGGPFGSLGPLPGEGISSATLFPEEDLFSSLSDPGADAVAAGSAEEIAGATPTWVGTVFAGASLADPGLAAGRATQTWLFAAPADLSLSLFVELGFVQLLSDRGSFASADLLFETIGGFGAGSTPGIDVLASWSYARALSGDVFHTDGAILFDETMALEADRTYWLTTTVATATALGPTTVTPEPASALLVGLGLAGLAALRGRGARARRGAGPA